MKSKVEIINRFPGKVERSESQHTVVEMGLQQWKGQLLIEIGREKAWRMRMRGSGSIYLMAGSSLFHMCVCVHVHV